METDVASTAKESEKGTLKTLGKYMFLGSHVHYCRSYATPRKGT